MMIVITALGYLMYLAYGVLVVYIPWFLYRLLITPSRYRPWIRQLSTRRQNQVRVLYAVFAMITVIVAVGIMVNQARLVGVDEAMLFLGSVVTGGVVYLVGLGVWHGDVASRLRLVGWLLMIWVAAIPSSLTILLPLTVPLVWAIPRARPLASRRPSGLHPR